MKKLWILLSVALALHCAKSDRLTPTESSVERGDRMNETGSIAIHYLNFLIETIPISMENIEKAAACVIRISSSSPEAEKLRSILLSAESGHFDNRVVRAKIEQLATDDIFVDIDGGIRFEPSGHERSLSKDGFEELSQLMNRLAPWDECH